MPDDKFCQISRDEKKLTIDQYQVMVKYSELMLRKSGDVLCDP